MTYIATDRKRGKLPLFFITYLSFLQVHSFRLCAFFCQSTCATSSFVLCALFMSTIGYPKENKGLNRVVCTITNRSQRHVKYTSLLHPYSVSPAMPKNVAIVTRAQDCRHRVYCLSHSAALYLTDCAEIA